MFFFCIVFSLVSELNLFDLKDEYLEFRILLFIELGGIYFFVKLFILFLDIFTFEDIFIGKFNFFFSWFVDDVFDFIVVWVLGDFESESSVFIVSMFDKILGVFGRDRFFLECINVIFGGFFFKFLVFFLIVFFIFILMLELFLVLFICLFFCILFIFLESSVWGTEDNIDILEFILFRVIYFVFIFLLDNLLELILFLFII